jgi:YidC/Oxa1 family membrane protein insertase
MNKKNVFVIGGIIAFIALYQFFVLAPYNAKLREAQLKQESAQTVASSPAAPGKVLEDNKRHNELSATAQTSLENIDVPLTRNVVSELAAGSDRSVQIIEGAAIGKAVIGNYFVRGAKEHAAVMLNNEHLEWSSSNPAIQRCLNSLKKSTLVGGDTGKVVMKASTAEGSCEFAVEPNAKHAGLLGVRLTLDGFEAGPADTVELRGRGTLGSSHQTDQNYISYKMDDSIHNVRGKDLFKKTEIKGRMSWMTWGDRYFSVIVKPSGTYTPNLAYESLPATLDAAQHEIPVSFVLRYPARPEAGKARFDFSSDIYFGTRDPSVLNEIAPELVETVDLGFFASVARIMLWALKSLNTVFHNFGVSIIALTLIVRLLFWPLNKKAYMSTIAMKELQPEMERIKKKYDNPSDRSQAEKMNKEIFALYKNKKVNPLGGCLPMLLQLPIFIGLYGALNHSIDLYQAPFFGWIQDLSMADPFYILPVLWTISLLGYMQINPQALNTSQPGMPNMKWIMMGMNVFFGFLSKDWPSGLVLYLVVSNCVGLSQQFFLQRASKKLQLLKEGA